MSLSRKILIGLLTGIAVGVFFGDLVAPLKVVANGYVKLLQMTVLPYVTISIISSLGGLDYKEAKRLGLRTGAVLLILWMVALSFAFLFPLTFPGIETASFFSTTLIETREPFDFVDIYIPSNPFHSLANSVVPAVVLFSVALGIALIGLERKRALLDVLSVAGSAVARVTSFVIRLTPFGIFAIAAHASGTLKLEQIQHIQVYLVSYVSIALLVAIWVLPGLVAALTPIRYGEILGLTRDALITAFMIGDLFVVLPILVESSRELLERHGLTNQHSRALPDVIVPVSFNFPHTGKLLSLSFVLFAGWFSGAVVPLLEYPKLAFTGLLTFFGSLNIAVPFLLDMFRIPADTFQLFLATGVINARFGSLVAASHTVAVALLGSAAIVGAVRFRMARVLQYLVVTVLTTGVTIGGLRTVFEVVLEPTFHGEEILYGMQPLVPHPQFRAQAMMPTEGPSDLTDSVLQGIYERNLLRVGVVSNRLPFVFDNRTGDLVGFDVEMAYQLSRDLGVDLKFYLAEIGELPSLLSSGKIDIAMTGFAVTPDRAAAMLFSMPYLDETLAFVVRDHLRDRFSSWAEIRTLESVRIGIVNVPYYIKQIRDRVPEGKIEVFEIPNILDQIKRFDAIVVPAETGSVLTLLNPQFTVVVPQPEILRVPLAYPIARRDHDWAHFINTWIDLKRKDGSLDRLYQHWILGQSAKEETPRWSIIRNVLGWL